MIPASETEWCGERKGTAVSRDVPKGSAPGSLQRQPHGATPLGRAVDRLDHLLGIASHPRAGGAL
jgi:hypothetical protein